MASECTDFIRNTDPGPVTGGADRGAVWFQFLHQYVNGLFSVHRDETGKIDALLTWGRYDEEVSISDVLAWKEFSATGPVIVILQLLSCSADATRSVIDQGIDKTRGFGACDLYAVRKGRVVKYPKRIVEKFKSNLN